jgi:hypothetical protein
MIFKKIFTFKSLKRKAGFMEDVSIKAILDRNLPIYLHGATGGDGLFVSDLLKKHRVEPAGIFDNPRLEYVPSVPKGIVIVATKERYRRNLLEKWRAAGHAAVDAGDIRLRPVYIDCFNKNKHGKDLPLQCRGCKASYRHCPVRSPAGGGTRDHVIPHIAIKVGSICNLRCKYCCEFTPRFKDRHKFKFDADAIIADIRKLSESCEYISVLSISGGDAMLNKGLERVIEKAASCKNIGEIYCLTNGTYVPNADILDAIQKYKDKAWIIINNYSRNNRAIPLIEELNRRGIKNLLRDNSGWYDFSDLGFRDRGVDELRQIYDDCCFDANDGHYHIMIQGKISMRCGVANAILHYLDKWNECPKDWIDIRALAADEIPRALALLEDRGYCDICNYCAMAAVEKRTIAPAEEQVNNNQGNQASPLGPGKKEI